ncbi:MAG: peptidase M24 [Acidobacteriales bacterium 13_1_40CM_3_55_5]|nr:MAG: peptidase M24 [Acidobacteriales bacterium 13_1_40CM_3_55_5]
MISRRRILKLGTAAAGAALATPVTAATSENNCTALPPSIASLTSMKDQAKPTTTEERGERQEKARRLMADNKLDAILLTEGTSLTYFSGIHWGGSERLFAMVLPVKGNVFYVCPAFEEGRAREQIAKAPGAEQADVRIWQEDGSPYQRVAQGLNDRGLSTGTLGMEETVRFVFSQGIGKASPQMKIASATPVTAGCRMIKSNHEVELMRLAAKVTLTAYEAAYHALNPGMTKPQLEEMVEAAHTRLGFSGSADAQVGEYSAFPHGSITPQVIREGAIVLMDGGGNVEGYASDITRTFVLGKPSDKMKTVFDIVHRAQTAALKTARPGLECQAVDAAARSVITDAGYGPDYKFFTHRVGHGMGMDVHEWPYLVRGNTTPMAANMTFSDEPGIYIRGEFGIRLEDDMHITENGAELVTPQSPSLEHPFEK